MSTQVITQELRQWIVEQATAGVSVPSVLASMMSSGWQEAVAVDAIEEVLAQEVARRFPTPAACPKIVGESDASTVWAHDKWVKVLLRLKHPTVAVFGDFLSQQECEQLKADASARLARSETVENNLGGSEVNSARTSQGMFFSAAKPICAKRLKRALLRWSTGLSRTAKASKCCVMGQVLSTSRTMIISTPINQGRSTS